MRIKDNINTLCLLFIMIISLSSCKKQERITPDYANVEAYEEALNNGEDTTGKIVCFRVDNIKPDSQFGYDLWAGVHLNFISQQNPKVKVGDVLTVKVVEVSNFVGPWLIKYEIIYIN